MEIKKITTLETFKVIGARKNLFTYTERYRQIRWKEEYQGCFVCNRKFNDGEKFGLVGTDKGNKTACNECIDKIINFNILYLLSFFSVNDKEETDALE